MSPEQQRFLHLHAHHHVEQWRSRWYGGLIQAVTNRGRTATVTDRQLDELVSLWLCERSHGVSVVLTAAGRAFTQKEESKCSSE
jgi:hypothetical protein